MRINADMRRRSTDRAEQESSVLRRPSSHTEIGTVSLPPAFSSTAL